LLGPDNKSISVYSEGTGLALKGLEALLKSSPNDMPNIFCVNIGTLVRNMLASIGDVKSSELVSSITNEIGALIQDVKGMMMFAGISKPFVYIYWHGYKKSIPEQLIRPESKTRSNINNNTTLLLNSRTDLLKDSDDKANVHVSITPEHYGRLPHNLIVRDLVAIPGKRDAIMLTHYPLDYHVINRRSTDLRILESFTGHIGDRERMSEKVFKDPKIPFCGITHQLLGDSEQIISPLKRNEIKLLKTTAVKDNWNLLPISDIKDKVNKLGFGQYVKID